MEEVGREVMVEVGGRLLREREPCIAGGMVTGSIGLVVTITEDEATDAVGTE